MQCVMMMMMMMMMLLLLLSFGALIARSKILTVLQDWQKPALAISRICDTKQFCKKEARERLGKAVEAVERLIRGCEGEVRWVMAWEMEGAWRRKTYQKEEEIFGERTRSAGHISL
jgi:hypothetical protein